MRVQSGSLLWFDHTQHTQARFVSFENLRGHVYALVTVNGEYDLVPYEEIATFTPSNT